MTRRGEKNLAVARKSRPPKARGTRQVRAKANGQAATLKAGNNGSATAGARPAASKGMNGHGRPLPGKRALRSEARRPATAITLVAEESASGSKIKSGKGLKTNGAAAGQPELPTVPRPAATERTATERQVIERCLQGDPAAWSIVYQRFHEPLASSVRAFLGKAGHDRNLVEEICARVWYALVRNNFELLARFDLQRGVRLTTFLTLLAKTQARLLLRSERRRRTREQVASKPEAHPPDATSWSVLEDHDFLATLSPAEQAFFQDVLVADALPQGPPKEPPRGEKYSRQYCWQLRHRVRRKLEDFLR